MKKLGTTPLYFTIAGHQEQKGCLSYFNTTSQSLNTQSGGIKAINHHVIHEEATCRYHSIVPQHDRTPRHNKINIIRAK